MTREQVKLKFPVGALVLHGRHKGEIGIVTGYPNEIQNLNMPVTVAWGKERKKEDHHPENLKLDPTYEALHPAKKQQKLSKMDALVLNPNIALQTVCPGYADLAPRFSEMLKVRLHGSNARAQDWDKIVSHLGIELPEGHRWIDSGSRGGQTTQRSLAATITMRDGRRFNSLELVLQLCSKAKDQGWHVTELA